MSLNRNETSQITLVCVAKKECSRIIGQSFQHSYIFSPCSKSDNRSNSMYFMSVVLQNILHLFCMCRYCMLSRLILTLPIYQLCQSPHCNALLVNHNSKRSMTNFIFAARFIDITIDVLVECEKTVLSQRHYKIRSIYT